MAGYDGGMAGYDGGMTARLTCGLAPARKYSATGVAARMSNAFVAAIASPN